MSLAAEIPVQNHLIGFVNDMAANGVTCEEPVADDGLLHRFRVEDDKSGKRSGWYILHGDNVPNGMYGNWRAGTTHKWCQKRYQRMSADERREVANRIRIMKTERDKEQRARWERAALKCQSLWSAANKKVAATHPYLVSKGVNAHGIRQQGETLLIPVYDTTGQLTSIQFITHDGEKRFKSGGKVQGGYTSIGKPTDTVYLCEGYATAASVFQATDCITVVCFNSGNLKAVAKTIREKYPDRDLIVCADNDTTTEGNPGFSAAREVSNKFGIAWTYPELDGRKVDFNDLHQSKGLAEVARQIETNMSSSSTGNNKGKRETPVLFSQTKSGIFFIGDDDPYFVCSPLEVAAITRDQNNQNFGRLLNWTDTDGNSHQWAMPMEMIAGDGLDLRKVLLSGGLTHIGSGKAKKLLMDYVALANPDKRATCVGKTGWHDSAFVLPDCVIGDSEKEAVIFQTEAGEANHFRCNQSLEKWQQNVARYCVGNSRLVFAVSMAFAAPLLEIVSMDGDGFNFKGSSSEGKSTALQVASSVCGGREYVCTWRATSNGLEGVAASHNDTLLILDEMGQVAPKEAGEISYMLANGQGKLRAGRNGSARAKREWKILFLSSGEISLADILLTTGQKIKAGQEVRLADIPMNTGKFGGFENLHEFDGGSNFADYLKEASSKYHGVAFRRYLELIADKLDSVSKAVKEIQRDFISEHCPKGAGGQVTRVALRFALVAAGGDFATSAGITGWPQGEAISAAEKCFKAWLDERGNIGNAEDLKALEQVTKFFQQHGQSRFANWDKDDSQKVIDRVGYVHHTHGEVVFYVFPQEFRTTVCKGLDHRRVKELLLERELMIADSGRKDVSRKPKNKAKSERFVCVRGEIVNG